MSGAGLDGKKEAYLLEHHRAEFVDNHNRIHVGGKVTHTVHDFQATYTFLNICNIWK
jgi:hypothetical protein